MAGNEILKVKFPNSNAELEDLKNKAPIKKNPNSNFKKLNCLSLKIGIWNFFIGI